MDLWHVRFALDIFRRRFVPRKCGPCDLCLHGLTFVEKIVRVLLTRGTSRRIPLEVWFRGRFERGPPIPNLRWCERMSGG